MRSTIIFGGIFFAAFGLLFLLFHSRMSEYAVKKWYEKYPNTKIYEKGYSIGFIILGVAFIAFGILTLSGVIKIKDLFHCGLLQPNNRLKLTARVANILGVRSLA